MKFNRFVVIFCVCFAFSVESGIDSEVWSFSKGRKHQGFKTKSEVKDLKEQVFSSGLSYDKRWKLVNTLTETLDEADAVDFLKKCTRSKEWFLQAAGVKNMELIKPDLALEEALNLLEKSPSLLVRSAAVKIIKKNGSKEHAKVLEEALSDVKNFKKKVSLWIRPQIAKAMKSLDRGVPSVDWEKWSNDLDPNVRGVAKRYTDSIK